MDQARTLAGAVDEARQWDRLMALARIGAIPGDGVNRQALTALDREARRLIIGWAEAAGARVSVDAAANLWLRLEGRDPTAAAGADRQPYGQPARGRTLRRHLWRRRGAGGAERAPRQRAQAGTAARGRRLDERGGEPLRARLHGQHGMVGSPPARGLRGDLRCRRGALRRCPGRASGGGARSAAPAAGRAAACPI